MTAIPKLTLCLAFLLVCEPVLAGDEVGNGGDAVACYDDDGELVSFELLDFYEAKVDPFLFARHSLPFVAAIPSYGETIEAQAAGLLEQLARHDPGRAGLYKERIAFFLSDVAFKRRRDIPEIGDDQVYGLMGNCRLVQAAIQFPGRRQNKFLVSLEAWDLFKKHSPESMLGLILHEVIYEEALQRQDARNSTRVRKLTAILSSTNMRDDMDSVRYLDALDTLQFDRRSTPFTAFCEQASLNPDLERTVEALLELSPPAARDPAGCGAAEAALGKLKHLNLSGLALADLRPISAFAQLTQIDLSQNDLRDAKSLLHLENLEGLNLAANMRMMALFAPGLAPKKLRQLTLPPAPFLRANLADLTGLEELNVDPGHGADGVARSLDFCRLFFDNVDPRMQQNLQVLRAPNQNISSLRCLDYLVGLETIDLSNNQLRSGDVLARLQGLRTLHLENNRLSDLDFLRRLPRLEAVYLRGNPGPKVCPVAAETCHWE